MFSLDNKVVVGNGLNDYFGQTEIYFQSNNSFQDGPFLPYSLEGATTVQFGDSLIVLGGNEYNTGKVLVTFKLSMKC